MSFLTQEQKDTFWQTGFLVMEDAVTVEELEGLRNEFSCWVEESREYEADYGETLDGRPRFDLQPGHSSEKPGLRRINLRKKSPVYLQTLCVMPLQLIFALS
jgi:phytanoyl-CoA hydroxylase